MLFEKKPFSVRLFFENFLFIFFFFKYFCFNPFQTIGKFKIVVAQYYEADVNKEHVIRGNAAILKCLIPSFVADFVEVVSWHTDQEETFYPDTNYGLWMKWQIVFSEILEKVLDFHFIRSHTNEIGSFSVCKISNNNSSFQRKLYFQNFTFSMICVNKKRLQSDLHSFFKENWSIQMDWKT